MKLLPVFYSTEQTVPDNPSFSPSAGKPARVVESWKKKKIPIRIVKPTPVSRRELELAHDPAYVRDVLDLKRPNGFENKHAGVAKSLPWTSGSMTSAAIEAVRNKQVAVSPTSGFHHAGYGFGGGYCTFNGLLVAAQVLKHKGLVDRVGILDLDQHYGNGTVDIIRAKKLDYIDHYTLGHENVRPDNAESWLADLPNIIRKRFANDDVLLYQAGADPHIEDPLGGRLTTDQMARRDEIVFKTCKEMGLPVAWNLAGGYQDPIEKVLALHDTTAKKCAEVYVFGD